MIVGGRGDHYWLHPEFKDDPKHKAFVQKFRDKTNAYPIYPVYHMVQGLQATVDGYNRAIKMNKGQWPSTEQVADAMHGMEFRGLTRTLRVREDGQSLEDQLLGTTKTRAGLPFMVMENMMLIPADLVTTPVGQKSPEWVKTLKTDILKSDKIKTYAK